MCVCVRACEIGFISKHNSKVFNSLSEMHSVAQCWCCWHPAGICHREILVWKDECT